MLRDSQCGLRLRVRIHLLRAYDDRSHRPRHARSTTQPPGIMNMILDRRTLLLSAAGAALSACGRSSENASTTRTPNAPKPAEPPVETGMADVPGGRVWWMRVGRDTG